jgi:hypothetical protein
VCGQSTDPTGQSSSSFHRDENGDGNEQDAGPDQQARHDRPTARL